MTQTPRHAAALAAAALLLAGCSNSPDPAGSTSPTTSAPSPTTTTASPSPTSTLSAAKQKAVNEAAAVVLARAQMFYDLQADPSPVLNRINEVVADPQLDLDLLSLRKASVAVAEGKKVVEDTGPVTLASVDPVKVDIEGTQPTVLLEACVDRTGTRSTYEGELLYPGRELARYRVVKTTYLPDPGWAVAQVLPPKGFDQPQPC